MRVYELFEFIKERHLIYERRAADLPKPWTDDPILRNYRFCNVYRELDTQTLWLADGWRADNADDEDFWFASLVFRFVNWSDTAELIGYPVPWKPHKFLHALELRKEEGKKMYSSAYMISTHGVREEKASYLARSLSKIWAERREIRWQKHDLLGTFHARLMNSFDVGSFLAGQVVADAKYVGKMKEAPDWHTFAASGPGSRRGLNRVMEREVNAIWREHDWRFHHKELLNAIAHLTKAVDVLSEIHGQDLQNCLCEFDKYERARLGEGRPKSRYNGGAE